MDELDRRLLALLRADARAPAAALAAQLKVSRGTVQNRIARLQAQGVIQGFTVRTRPELETQRVRAVMSIAVEGERTAAVIRRLKGFPAVERIYTTNGRWDLIVEFGTTTLTDLDAVLRRIRLIPGVTNSETNLLLATPRSTKAKL